MSEQPKENIAPISNQKLGYRIVLAGFAAITGMAVVFLFKPEDIAAPIITGAISFIGGFLAGRKS